MITRKTSLCQIYRERAAHSEPSYKARVSEATGYKSNMLTTRSHSKNRIVVLYSQLEARVDPLWHICFAAITKKYILVKNREIELKRWRGRKISTSEHHLQHPLTPIFHIQVQNKSQPFVTSRQLQILVSNSIDKESESFKSSKSRSDLFESKSKIRPLHITSDDQVRPP